ncbi:MAG: Verru_Chthon cassette protein B [Candidatus Udaeobacter sp.]
MKRSTCGAAGFSLIEVTLALGIAAFCLIAVFGLMPVAVMTNRNATSRTAATNLMAAVIADLRAIPTTKTTSAQFGISYGTSGTQTLYFDGSGTASTVLTANSRYRLDITWNTPPTGLAYADVKVWWPAAASAVNASGSTEVFAAFDRN